MLLLDAVIGKVFSVLIALGCRSLLNRRVFSFSFLIKSLFWNEPFWITKLAWFKYYIAISTKNCGRRLRVLWFWFPWTSGNMRIAKCFLPQSPPLLLPPPKKKKKRNLINSCIHLHSFSGNKAMHRQRTFDRCSVSFASSWPKPSFWKHFEKPEVHRLFSSFFFRGQEISYKLPVFGHSLPFN